jgi:tRNA nucleotidyltransferase (CCA-adding enzyme)
MQVPAPEWLLARIAELPAAPALLSRLGDTPGVHLVGGSVRDLLLDGRPLDLDLVVEGDAAAFAQRLGGELRSYDRFGTATVVLDGHSYDIAGARRESYSAPGALPDVVPATLHDDLERRDFTVNAAAVELAGPRAGTLRAVPAALGDLDARRLRVLHDRSFVDDPTRLLRLARYSARLGFEIEPQTLALARTAIDDGALRTVSGPRSGAELRLLALEPDPIGGFHALRAFGLDHATAAAAGLDEASAERFELDDPELASRSLELLPDDGRSDLTVLALAARGVPRAELEVLLERLAFEAGDRDVIITAATGADVLAQSLGAARRPSEIGAALAGVPAEAVAIAGAVGPADAARDWLHRLRLVSLEIDGSDLLAAGVAEGPAIGRGLRAALAAKLDGRASGREAELDQALAAATQASE